jgi:hypothetical protein
MRGVEWRGGGKLSMWIRGWQLEAGLLLEEGATVGSGYDWRVGIGMTS